MDTIYHKNKIVFLLALLFLSGIAYTTRAQDFLPQPLSLKATPQFPSPGDTVTIEAATPTFDKDTIDFQWAIDGRVRKDLSGPGKNSFTYTAGVLGSISDISVTATPASGLAAGASLQVPVEGLTLTWFAETYIPKWYEGKALPIQDSIVDVIAIPEYIINGSTIRPENLIYHWSLNGDDGLSGIGQQKFRVKLSGLPSLLYRVGVTVEDTNKKINKKEEIILKSFDPKVVIYPATPLGGVEIRRGPDNFTTAVTGLLDFIAEPFYFAVNSKNDLDYKWSVGGNEVQGAPKNQYVLTVDTSGQSGRNFPISVSTRDASNQTDAAAGLLNLIIQ